MSSLVTDMSSSNEPKWLDEFFLQKCLQQKYSDEEVNIKSFSAEPATAKGENFLSDIIRVKATYSRSGDSFCATKNVSLIIKIASKDPNVLACVSSMNIYNKEMEMYEKILPKVHALLRKHSEFEKIFPETICLSQEHGAIVFEDLLASGFAISKKKSGYDLDHVKMILIKLAKFTAANAVLEEENQADYQNFRKGLFDGNTSWLTKLYEGQMDAVIELVAGWEGYDYYVAKLRNFRSHLRERCVTEMAPSPNHYNTLNHGDMWTNNIMLKYDETGNKLEDVSLIDLQLVRWSSPSWDLHHLFNTSIEEELRLHHQEELVQFYHKELTRVLRKLGFKKHIPTLLEFQVQFLEKAFFAVTAALVNQPFMIYEGDVKPDSESVFEDNEHAAEFRRHMMSSSVLIQTKIKNLLPIFDRKGLFD